MRPLLLAIPAVVASGLGGLYLYKRSKGHLLGAPPGSPGSCAPPPPPPPQAGAPAVTISALAADGTTVKDVQLALNTLGYANPLLVADGVIGPLTTAAVKAFQTHAGITVDGIVGPVTLDALHLAMQARACQAAHCGTTVAAGFFDDPAWCEPWGGDFSGQFGLEQEW